MQLLDLDWSLPVSHGMAVCSFVGPASLAPLLAAISHKISRLSLGGKRCTATLLSPSLYMYVVCLALPSPCMFLFSSFVFSKFPQIPVFSCLLPRLELAIQSLVNIWFKNIYSYCAKLQRDSLKTHSYTIFSSVRKNICFEWDANLRNETFVI